jgi:predicted RNA-binding Zn-ribbon protein involved in translation (DUF1610 family)
MDNSANALSLADLEAFDGQNAGRGVERRFLCPECGDGKPRDAAHRSMAANMETGAYNCHRCKASGKLKDFWTDRPRDNGSQPRSASQSARRANLRRAFDVQPVAPAPAPDENAEWRRQLDGLASLDDTPGARYLAGRGIPVDVAALADVRFCRSWYGRPAVMFPLCNQAEEIIAAQGRYIDGRTDPKTRTGGPKSQALFTAHSIVLGQLFHATDKRLPAIILTEAPIDALTLAACGFPAVALCGTSGPAWLHRVCGLRRVLLATDADEAGDKAAGELAAQLSPFGARCDRLRPDGAKDWNAMLLQIGRDALADWLAARVL